MPETPHHCFRVDGTPVFVTELPVRVPLARGRRPSLHRRTAPRRACDYNALAHRMAARQRHRQHGAAWLPPVFQTDMMPGLRELKRLWQSWGL